MDISQARFPLCFVFGSFVFGVKILRRNQSLKTTVAPNSKYKIDKNSPVDIMARFFGLSQKLAPTRKIVPTDQHYQHVFATLLHRLFTPSEEKIKRP